ncbi:hypothetical protein INT45_002724 [Circinella minor]|uniref:Xylanolytic transcriptional activator regulatory domain-containing protein n=1 Tax=Circinella minor TaxID=1195481 RepID=A0A8H7S527_9FUNG|nr:hypothetical protein INT45_002724 [Circinella minor]
MNAPFESGTNNQLSATESNKKSNKRSRTARAWSRYVDTLEKRIQKIESTLSSIGHYSTTVSSFPTSSVRPVTSPKEKSRRFIPFPKNKQEKGDTLDSVRFLGDMPELEMFRDHIGEKEYYEVGERKYRKVGRHYVEIVSPTDDPLEKKRFRGPPIPRTVTGINHWIYSMSGVDRYTSDRLMKIYFMNVHPLLPVINKTEFLRQYRDQADTYPSAELLNAMFGAAARFLEVGSQKKKSTAGFPDLQWEAPANWHIRFFEQSHALVTVNPPKSSVSTVQTSIIIYNTSGNVSSSESEGWIMSGTAIRLAQFFALNRDCDGWDIPENEKETRKRIWWSLYISDRFQAANVGRPLSIHDEDNDVAYPDPTESWTEILDEPRDENDDAWPRFPSSTFRPESIEGRAEIYELFIQLIKLSEILGHILQALYTPRASKISLKYGWDQIVTRLDHELTEWRFGFPTALDKTNYKDFDEINGYFAPTIASLLLCYFGSLILLHRPFIERNTNISDRPSYSSFRISSSAATRGIRIAEQMSMRDYLMLPYCFNITPILQFSLIHIYNSRNSDGRIAAPSRAYVFKTMELVTNIQHMSKRATQLYRVLKFIIDNMNITIETEANTPTPNDETAAGTATTAVTLPSREATPPLPSTATTITEKPTTVEKHQSQPEDTQIESGIPRKISDVGRGISPLQQSSARSTNTSAAPPTGSLSSSSTSTATETIAVPAATTAVPTVIPNYFESQQSDSTNGLQSWDTEWVHNTYLPSNILINLENPDSRSTYKPPSNGSEAFTIRQFGYDTQNCSSGELEIILRNISTASLPLSDVINSSSADPTATTRTLSAQPLSQQQQQEHLSTTSTISYGLNTESQSTVTSVFSPLTNIIAPLPQSHSIQQPQSQLPALSTQQQNIQNTFHNDPNNPFYSVPVSLDMGEWNEWMQQLNNSTANPFSY